jgi:ABC-type transport system involved in cytochrome c biogenesis permease subunit
MMGWDVFIYFAIASIGASLAASVLALCDKRKIAIGLSVTASLALAGFIGMLWISLERPPLRTMGETRLWYSFFAGIAGLITYLRWRYKWILSFSTVLSTVFILLNLLKPEIHDQTLMPALQSPWFIPHVTVYMFSYSLLGCAFLIGVVRLFKKDDELFRAADTLVYIGVAFLTFGMLSGSIWAKSAWGHFWNWDPKETWALITWLVYLLYIHLRLYRRNNVKLLCFLLIFAFACLQMCWWGINFLPSAADSIHVY